jgi:hypothetical protein
MKFTERYEFRTMESLIHKWYSTTNEVVSHTLTTTKKVLWNFSIISPILAKLVKNYLGTKYLSKKKII